jgi:Flp pilus assembly pilin Flp
MSKFMSLVRDEEGIQHAEEALLLSLIAVVAAVTVKTLGGTITNTFTTVNGKFS